MSARHAFEHRLSLRWPPERWCSEGVVVGVSGGADSMALVSALAALAGSELAGSELAGSELGGSELGGSEQAGSEPARIPRSAAPLVAAPLVAAHFNHRLRGAESDADAAFVDRQAAELEVRSIVGTGDVAGRAARDGDGLEAAARNERYDFLTDTAVRLGFRYVATAHTEDDQAETVLHRLLRGTGPGGLAGIARARGLAGGAVGLVRPLLAVRRSEVLEYLSDVGRPYRDDSSNEDLRFTRNRIRRELLPQLARDYNPQIVETLARLASQAEEYRSIVAELVAPVYRRGVVAVAGGAWSIDCAQLADGPPLVLRELLVRVWIEAGLPLQAMGYDEWSSLAAMVRDADAAARDLPGNVAVRRQGNLLTAARR